MALRNCDLDSVVRGLIEGTRDYADAVSAAAAAKLKACGVKLDAGKGVKRLPVHSGRRNPLAGQVKGSGDVNLRSIVDWIDSIEALGPLADGEEASEERKAMQAAHDALVVVHATAAARSA